MPYALQPRMMHMRQKRIRERDGWFIHSAVLEGEAFKRTLSFCMSHSVWFSQENETDSEASGNDLGVCVDYLDEVGKDVSIHIFFW